MHARIHMCEHSYRRVYICFIVCAGRYSHVYIQIYSSFFISAVAYWLLDGDADADDDGGGDDSHGYIGTSRARHLLFGCVLGDFGARLETLETCKYTWATYRGLPKGWAANVDLN